MPPLKKNVTLAPYTTLGIGGSAEFFVATETVAELAQVLLWAQLQEMRVTILGGGSNVLISDAGIPGVVIMPRILGVELVKEDADSVTLRVGAGEDWDALVAHTVEQGWWGLENLSCIPGSVGATPIQNIGAYGVEVGAYMSAVHTMHIPTQNTQEFSAEDCTFGYRDSFFKTSAGREHVVTEVEFTLSKHAQPQLHYADLVAYFSDKPAPTQTEIREAVCTIRSGKFPDWKEIGTAGSYFKNPLVSPSQFKKIHAHYPEVVSYEAAGAIKLSAAWLIDHVAGMRGVRVGAVGTFEQQALVLVAHDGATAAAVVEFAEKIITRIYQKIGITLEPEVQFYPQTRAKN